MARTNNDLLDNGDRLPDLHLQTVSGKTMRLPEDLGEGFAAIFFYRGYW